MALVTGRGGGGSCSRSGKGEARGAKTGRKEEGQERRERRTGVGVTGGAVLAAGRWLARLSGADRPGRKGTTLLSQSLFLPLDTRHEAVT